jgi:glucose/mannose-6-phosphate isomerase
MITGHEAVETFPEQLQWQPTLSGGVIPRRSLAVVAGMGGSHLAADLLARTDNSVFVHHEYGLPCLPKEILEQSFFVASSYSGGTEETLDFAEAVLAAGWPLGVVATGGPLLTLAREHELPYVEIPADEFPDLPPRFATGYSLVALIHLLGKQALALEVNRLSRTLDITALEQMAHDIFRHLDGSVPLFYTSTRNSALGYIWKISCNETGKLPAFANTLPELNHNEIVGFGESSESLHDPLVAVFLHDSEDDKRIQERMNTTNDLLRDARVSTYRIDLPGLTAWEKALANTVLAAYTAVHLAESSAADPLETNIINQLKKHMAHANSL